MDTIDKLKAYVAREQIRDKAVEIVKELALWDDNIPEQVPAEIGACIDDARELVKRM